MTHVPIIDIGGAFRADQDRRAAARQAQIQKAIKDAQGSLEAAFVAVMSGLEKIGNEHSDELRAQLAIADAAQRFAAAASQMVATGTFSSTALGGGADTGDADALAAVRQEAADLRAQLATAGSLVASLQRTNDQLQSAVDRLTPEAIKASDQAIALAECSTTITQLRANLSAANSNKNTLTEQVADLKQQLAAATTASASDPDPVTPVPPADPTTTATPKKVGGLRSIFPGTSSKQASDTTDGGAA